MEHIKTAAINRDILRKIELRFILSEKYPVSIPPINVPYVNIVEMVEDHFFKPIS